jgi:hypothetical protein
MSATTLTLRPTKASFTCLDNGALTIAEVPFNPASFSIARTVSWADNPVKSAAWAGMSFDKGMNDELDMTLLLDESEGATYGVPNTASVMGMAQAFHALSLPVQISATEIRPPAVVFTWELFRFQGVVSYVKVEFTLFSTTGAARRAMVTLKMKGQAFQTATTGEAVLTPTYTPGAAAATSTPSSYYGSLK